MTFDERVQTVAKKGFTDRSRGAIPDDRHSHARWPAKSNVFSEIESDASREVMTNAAAGD